MPAHRTKTAVITALLVLGAGCAPIKLSSPYSPPAIESLPTGNAAGACRISLGDVRDLRSDTQAMGQLHDVVVTASDTAGWVRSAFLSLGRDARLHFDDKTADLSLSVDLLKAYVTAPTNSTRSATVVVRVHYGRPGAAPDDKIYRGTDSGVNWVNGSDETQASLDSSLGDILKDVDRDILSRCTASN